MSVGTLREGLAAEAATYQWLDPHRVRTADDPDLASTVVRLYQQREEHRCRANVAEHTLACQQIAIEALSEELRRHNQIADLGDVQ
jgi:hypothetical protein